MARTEESHEVDLADRVIVEEERPPLLQVLRARAAFAVGRHPAVALSCAFAVGFLLARAIRAATRESWS